MPTYNTPGVYVEEIASLPGSIVAVQTAVPAFIGFTETNANEYVPYRITSLAEYEAVYGGPNPETIEFEINDTVAAGTLLKRKIDLAMTARLALNMHYQLQMYFANGGGACYIVSVGDYGADPALTDYDADIWTNLEKVDEITLLVFPDPPYDTANSVVDLDDYGTLIQSALLHCDKMGDRFTIIDGVDTTAATPLTWQQTYRNAIGSLNLSLGAAYYPNLKTSLSFHYDETMVLFNDWFENSVSKSATTAMPVGSHLDDLKAVNNALYRQVKAAIENMPLVLSPCGAMAGVYCRTDRERGVWKAPANVGLANVLAPAVLVTDAMQDGLNVDASNGKSINVIRSFPGKGTLVWGARTLDGNSSEWRYVPVRRLFLMMEESIQQATEFAVFEPNDASTWIRVKSMIENFLNDLWRQGALAGAKPEQAYQVRVGLNSTMTPQDILDGRMIIEVAVAAVRPAEFIVLRFSHHILAS